MNKILTGARARANISFAPVVNANSPWNFETESNEFLSPASVGPLLVLPDRSDVAFDRSFQRSGRLKNNRRSLGAGER